MSNFIFYWSFLNALFCKLLKKLEACQHRRRRRRRIEEYILPGLSPRFMRVLGLCSLLSCSMTTISLIIFHFIDIMYILFIALDSQAVWIVKSKKNKNCINSMTYPGETRAASPLGVLSTVRVQSRFTPNLWKWQIWRKCNVRSVLLLFTACTAKEVPVQCHSCLDSGSPLELKRG